MLTVDFEKLRLLPGMKTLDAGCGQGRHSLEFLRRGCSVIGMDLIPEDLVHTRYLLTAVGREIEVGAKPAFLTMRGNALNLPFEDNAFDRIICSEVLEHVTDPDRAAAELSRVLKPDGILAVSVPTPFTEWAYWFASDDYFNTPGGHVRIFTAGSLSRLLARQGLTVEDINMEHAFHSIYWWVRCVFGLHDDDHPVIHHFKKILTYFMFSARLTAMEKRFNHILPKSMVLYARKGNLAGAES